MRYGWNYIRWPQRKRTTLFSFKTHENFCRVFLSFFSFFLALCVNVCVENETIFAVLGLILARDI